MPRLLRYRPEGKLTTYQCRLGRIDNSCPPLTTTEKRHLLGLLDQATHFYGFELLAYAVIAREFECVLRSPKRKSTKADAIARIAAYHGAAAADRVAANATDKISLNHLSCAMSHYGDLAMLIKRVKGSFSRYYNKRHPRSRPAPPIWHDRYRADILQNTPSIILAACAEVELLPGLRNDRRHPEKNPFTSFGAAAAGDEKMRASIRKLTGKPRWPSAAAAYRKQIESTPPPPRGSGRHGRKGTVGNLSLDDMVASPSNRQSKNAGRSHAELLRTTTRHLKNLHAFHKRFGHTRVPLEWGKNSTLAMWVKARRSLHRQGKLSAELIANLDALGFEWQIGRPHYSQEDELRPDLYRPDAVWLDQLEALRQFITRHGHHRVPMDANHTSLSRWVYNQRHLAKKGKLSRSRQQLLDEIGFR